MNAAKVSDITPQMCAEYLRIPEPRQEDLTTLQGFLDAAVAFVRNYTGLADLDLHPEFRIPVFMLVQNFYDSRSIQIDTRDIEHVFECILGMHSINLI